MKLEKRLFVLTNGKKTIGSAVVDLVGMRGKCKVTLLNKIEGVLLVRCGVDCFFPIENENTKSVEFLVEENAQIDLFVKIGDAIYFSGQKKTEDFLGVISKFERWQNDKAVTSEKEFKTQGNVYKEEDEKCEIKNSNEIAQDEIATCVFEYCDDMVAQENFYPSNLVWTGFSIDDKMVEKTEINDTVASKRDLFVCDVAKTTYKKEQKEVAKTRKNSVRLLCKNDESSTVLPFRSKESESKRSADFFESVKKNIDELFSKFEREREMENLMPDTKWVKINYGGGKFYLVGLMGARPDYVCYGVVGQYSANPPACFENSASFLPKDVKKPQGDGYWIIFQDARTGKVHENK